LLDTHDNHVTDPVWELYRLAHQKTSGVSSLLEWDAKIPPFPIVHAEVLKARQYMTTQLAPLAETDPHSFPFENKNQSSSTPPHPATLVLAEVE